MIQESVNKSQSVTIIKATAEGLWQELGFKTKIGTIHWKIVKEYVTPTWYGYIMEFGSTFNGYWEVIEIIEDVPSIPLLREHNSFIMVAFINAIEKGT